MRISDWKTTTSWETDDPKGTMFGGCHLSSVHHEQLAVLHLGRTEETTKPGVLAEVWIIRGHNTYIYIYNMYIYTNQYIYIYLYLHRDDDTYISYIRYHIKWCMAEAFLAFISKTRQTKPSNHWPLIILRRGRIFNLYLRVRTEWNKLPFARSWACQTFGWGLPPSADICVAQTLTPNGWFYTKITESVDPNNLNDLTHTHLHLFPRQSQKFPKCPWPVLDSLPKKKLKFLTSMLLHL